MYWLLRNRMFVLVSSGGLCVMDYDEDNIFLIFGLIFMMYKYVVFFLNFCSYGFGVFFGDWKEMIV